MKGIYWRPKNVSRNVLVLIAFMAIGGIVAVESFKIEVKQDYYPAKLKAARQMDSAMKELRKLREKLDVPLDIENDPTGSGLIGWPFSQVTSNTGYLDSKQTTINPNFAAVIVHMFKKAGVEAGDVVAVGFSGSFPALNIATLAACDALDVEPVIISSASASEWGANIPGLTWLEMENHLFVVGMFKHQSLAASIGGVADRGHGMSKEGKEALKAIIQKVKLPLLWPRTMVDAIDQRMAIYEEAAGERPIKAYVNVGGGTISVGTVVGKHLFRPGVNKRMPPNAAEIDSVMVRFAAQGVPVIHLSNVKELATQYGLPAPALEPQQAGKGNIFNKIEYNRWLVGGVLVVLLVALWLLVRLNLAHRFTAPATRKSDGVPEAMV